MKSVLFSLFTIDVFQMTGLLRCTFFSKQETKYVSIYLNEDLEPQMKISPSGHVVLYDIQCFILVTLSSNISKNELHELGDPHHTLSVYCGWCIRITSENTQVYLSKKG